VTAPARLLGLRLQGFKSFAERTQVEFGGGISAVVGPNGSGKSNLADALRWALGEQGRSLRTRKSEDVIWAGSERRAALGMADVQLVLDNADGLLPVEYGVVELGRRLYRSGENDYLLNRSRVRLRDLVDLLDAAHLAENAFLFIGQGMVDQALALRPEERRPLFEEVAGVRRHERRRRKASEQLLESETNLGRVEDILAELRPQARRLAQLAEQQTSRRTAGEELADAIVATAHARWHAAAARVTETGGAREKARAATDLALQALEAAENDVAAIARVLEQRAGEEAERRTRYEMVREATAALRVREARLASDVEALARDRQRLDAERAAAEADLVVERRVVAEPVVGRDVELEGALGEAERDLADALGELATLRASRQARGDELAAVRRAEAARATEIETARRRVAEAQRRADEEQTLAAAAAARADELESRLTGVRTALAAAAERERAAAADRESLRNELDEHDGRRQAAAEQAVQAGAALAAARGRLETGRARLADEETRGIARLARRRGARRVDEEIVVEARFRAAVETALGDRARAYLVPGDAVTELADQRGMLVVGERLVGTGGERSREGTRPATASMFEVALASVGGGRLTDAVRRDPAGSLAALLDGVGWVPDLASALRIQVAIPPGGAVVVRDGSALLDGLSVRLGAVDGPLEMRAAIDRLGAEIERLEASSAAAESSAEVASAAAAETRRAHESARADESAAVAERRRLEDAERVVDRELEGIGREAEWHRAQAERFVEELERARVTLEILIADQEQPSAGHDGTAATTGAGPDDTAVTTWEARAVELRARRDRLAADTAALDARRRDAEARRARAEAAVALDEARIAGANRELNVLREREAALTDERARIAVDLAAAVDRETQARDALESLVSADVADRARLAEAERVVARARDALRLDEDRLRAAEVADLEARLGLDALREGLLVELAALGEVALASLASSDSTTQPSELTAEPDADEERTALLGRAIREAARRWESEPPPTELPSNARLGALRRRFHELGAANPFAVDEYAALRERVEGLETQAADLRGAIATTRALIVELDTMIATQFRATFAALETAFDARFQQLFGGGFARLSLTEPDDLGATGVEIVARPPGKKAQALAMLSGGERALTAVALLFAMLEVRPVPFCVLDEVDAALDEANVGRFTDALRSLAERTQFIVITHNRGTIEVADALYGVTVGDDSVSRVISLRLEEATTMADRRASRRETVAVAPG